MRKHTSPKIARCWGLFRTGFPSQAPEVWATNWRGRFAGTFRLTPTNTFDGPGKAQNDRAQQVAELALRCQSLLARERRLICFTIALRDSITLGQSLLPYSRELVAGPREATDFCPIQGRLH